MFAVVDLAEAIQHSRTADVFLFLSAQFCARPIKLISTMVGGTGAASSPLHSTISLLDSSAICFIMDVRNCRFSQVSVCLRNLVPGTTCTVRW